MVINQVATPAVWTLLGNVIRCRDAMDFDEMRCINNAIPVPGVGITD